MKQKIEFKKWRIFILVSLCLVMNFHLMAQNTIQVRGTVTGSDGALLPGVTVVQKSTTNGTVTDINGKYSLKVPSNEVLVFSFIGMKKQEVSVCIVLN